MCAPHKSLLYFVGNTSRAIKQLKTGIKEAAQPVRYPALLACLFLRSASTKATALVYVLLAVGHKFQADKLARQTAQVPVVHYGTEKDLQFPRQLIDQVGKA